MQTIENIVNGLVANNVGGIQTKRAAEDVIKAVFNHINHATTVVGDEVRIHGFGTFKISKRAARKGRNPQTGEAIDIPASSSLTFKATKSKK